MKYVLLLVAVATGSFLLSQAFSLSCLVLLRSLLSTETPMMEMLANSVALGVVTAIPVTLWAATRYAEMASKEDE